MTFGRQKRPKGAAAHPVEKPGEWFGMTMRINVYRAVMDWTERRADMPTLGPCEFRAKL
jgi:hypothetical protein